MITDSCCIKPLISHDFQKGERMPLDLLMESYCLACTSSGLATSAKCRDRTLPSPVSTVGVESAVLWMHKQSHMFGSLKKTTQVVLCIQADTVDVILTIRKGKKIFTFVTRQEDTEASCTLIRGQNGPSASRSPPPQVRVTPTQAWKQTVCVGGRAPGLGAVLHGSELTSSFLGGNGWGLSLYLLVLRCDGDTPKLLALKRACGSWWRGRRCLLSTRDYFLTHLIFATKANHRGVAGSQEDGERIKFTRDSLRQSNSIY